MLFSILLIGILLYTGWLPTFAKETKCSIHMIYLFLFAMIISYFVPSIPVTHIISIHLGWSLILFGCVFLFLQIEAHKKWWFLTVVLSSASIAFSFHEIYHLHTDWTQFHFRVLLILLFVFGGFIAYRKWVEQICYLWMGLIVTDGMILFAHHEMLNPLIIGGQAFLDTCWLIMLFCVLVHFGSNFLPAWIRKQRG